MTKILAMFAVVATAAFVAPPSSASAASMRGSETDRAATAPTDISAHRRRYRYRAYTYYRPYWKPYPYYAYSYPPNPYRAWYWGPRLFPYGPWW